MRNLSFTFKVWPVVAALTIGLCYLTQTVAGWFGLELPDQQNVELVRRVLEHAFESSRHFAGAAFLVVQVVVIMPVLEEFCFRWLLFKIPLKFLPRRGVVVWALAAVGSALFVAAHYLMQPWPDAAFIALFFFGLAQCWLYRRTDRLWCAMLNHALFNLTNLLLLLVLPCA